MCYARLGHLFPYLPKQPGYHKRLKAAAPLLAAVMDYLARECPSWGDQVRLIDATPVPCGASRETVRRSELAGWAGYGYCAAHSRWYWGLKLYLLTTPDGMPVAWCLASPKIGEREVAAGAAGARRPHRGAAARADPDRGQGLRRARTSRTWSPTTSGCAWSARIAATSHPAMGRSGGSASGSNRSTTPSKASSTWNATAAGPRRASIPGSPSACSPWPLPSGTTGPPPNPSSDR